VRETWVYLQWEWRLFVRGPFVWLLAAFAVGHALLVHAGGDWIRHIGYYVNHFHFLYVAPFSIFALLAGVHAARRDRGLGIDRFVEGLPYATGKRLTAQFIITLLPYAVIGSVPAIIWTFLAVQQLDRTDRILLPAIMLFSSVVGIGFLVTLGLCIGRWVLGRISYFVGFVLWMVTVYGSLFATRFMPVSLSRWTDPLLIDYRTTGYYDDTWGFIPDITLWLHRGLYTVLGVLLLLLLYWAMAGRRKEPVYVLGLSGAVLAGIVSVTLLSAWNIGIKEERVEANERKLENALANEQEGQPAASSLSWEDIGFEVASYNVSVVYREEGRLAIKAMIQAHAASAKGNADPKELVFTLNQQFDLKEVKVNGDTVAYSREGDVVKLPLMSRESGLTDLKWLIEWTYAGKVDDWRLFHPYGNNDNVLAEAHFADDSKLFLPAAYGWYPLPGSHRLVSVMETRSKHNELYNVYTPIKGDDKTRFRLQVDYPDTLNLFTNLDFVQHEVREGRQIVTFQGRGVACGLIGGALKERRYGNEALTVRLIGNKMSDEKHIQKAVESIHQTKMEIDRILKLTTSRSEWVLLPISPEKITGVQPNLGGLKLANGYIVLGLPSYYETPVSDVLTWGSYLPNKAPPQDRSLWMDAISEYIKHRKSGQPIELTRFPFQQDDPKRMEFEEMMNENSNEQNEALLRKMYRELWEFSPIGHES
jgi:hypothetical protein